MIPALTQETLIHSPCVVHPGYMQGKGRVDEFDGVSLHTYDEAKKLMTAKECIVERR